MIFKSKKIPQNSYLNGKRIGVLGLAPRCGATHIAVAISNYLADTEKKRVSLLERNRHDDLKSLITELGGSGTEPAFTFHRVTYVPSGIGISLESMPDLNSDCMVFDFGFDLKASLPHMLLCDIKILVGVEAPWCKDEYSVIEHLSNSYGLMTSWRLFVNLGNPKLLKGKDRYGMTACCFPFEPDPVYPGLDTCNILREMVYD